MAVEQNKEVVRRQFQLVSDGDAEGAAALYSPSSLNHGKKVDRGSLGMVLKSVVSLEEKFTVHEMIGEGDWVACRVTVTGRNITQPTVPIDGGIHAVAEPTGKEYTFQHMHLFKVVNGQIVEHWANRDDLGAARQLGLDLKPSTNSTV